MELLVIRLVDRVNELEARVTRVENRRHNNTVGPNKFKSKDIIPVVDAGPLNKVVKDLKWSEMIEICSQCMAPINTKTDTYLTGRLHGEQYFIHPACYKEWVALHK